MIYHYISLYIIKYHYIYHHISLYIIIYHHISSYIIIYLSNLSYLTLSYPIPPYPILYHPIYIIASLIAQAPSARSWKASPQPWRCSAATTPRRPSNRPGHRMAPISRGWGKDWGKAGQTEYTLSVSYTLWLFNIAMQNHHF